MSGDLEAWLRRGRVLLKHLRFCCLRPAGYRSFILLDRGLRTWFPSNDREVGKYVSELEKIPSANAVVFRKREVVDERGRSALAFYRAI